MVSVHRVSTRTPVDDDARRVRAELAGHGTVVLLGRRSQARQLRRIQAALRTTGHVTAYRTDGDLHVLTVSTGPAPRAVAWWGGLH